MNLSKKMTLYVSMIVILVAGSLGVAAITLSGGSIREQVDHALVQQAQDGSKLIADVVDEQLVTFGEVANRPAVQTMDFDEQQNDLGSAVERLGYMDIGIVSPDGTTNYILSGDTAELGDRGYVQRAFNGEANVSDVIISRVTNSAVLMYAVPIYGDDAQNNIVGVMIGRRDGNFLSEITGGLGYGQQGYAYMINDAGTVVAHDDREMVMEQFNALELVQEDPSVQGLAGSVQDVLEEGTGVGAYTIDGLGLHTGYTPVEGTNWYLVINAVEAEALAGLNSLRNYIMIGTLLVLLLGVIASRALASSISRPIIELSSILERLSNYDLSFDENSKAVDYLKRKDEIGTITNSMATMQQNLVKLIKNITESAQSVASSSEELTATAHQSTTAANEVAKTIEEIAQGASDQARDTESGVMSVNQMGNLIEENRTVMENLNRSAGEMREAKDQGTNSLNYTIEKYKASSTAAEEIAETIVEANNSAKQIQNASGMIQSIAEQTNLLALNAAIESARAGEAGRGFAVVADEIRKLAEQTSKFTAEIEKVIKELNVKTEGAVKTMDHVASIDEEQAKGIKDTQDKFEKINESIIQVETMIQQLNTSGTEMNTKKEEIVSVMENLSAISEENAAGTQEASASVEEQTAGMEEIARSSEALAKLSEEMQETISQFKY